MGTGLFAHSVQHVMPRSPIRDRGRMELNQLVRIVVFPLDDVLCISFLLSVGESEEGASFPKFSGFFKLLGKFAARTVSRLFKLLKCTSFGKPKIQGEIILRT